MQQFLLDMSPVVDREKDEARPLNGVRTLCFHHLTLCLGNRNIWLTKELVPLFPKCSAPEQNEKSRKENRGGLAKARSNVKKTTNEQRQVADDNHHLPINISYMITPSDHQSQELV